MKRRPWWDNALRLLVALAISLTAWSLILDAARVFWPGKAGDSFLVMPFLLTGMLRANLKPEDQRTSTMLMMALCMIPVGAVMSLVFHLFEPQTTMGLLPYCLVESLAWCVTSVAVYYINPIPPDKPKQMPETLSQ